MKAGFLSHKSPCFQNVLEVVGENRLGRNNEVRVDRLKAKYYFDAP
jgi:hypothetical protein